MTDKIQWGTGGSAELILRALRQAYPDLCEKHKTESNQENGLCFMQGSFLIASPLDSSDSKCYIQNIVIKQ